MSWGLNRRNAINRCELTFRDGKMRRNDAAFADFMTETDAHGILCYRATLFILHFYGFLFFLLSQGRITDGMRVVISPVCFAASRC